MAINWSDPELIKALLGAGGAGLETFSQYQQSKANRDQQQQLSRSATLQNLFEGDQSEDFLRERTALDATQLNPFAQLEADQSQAIRAALLGNISNVQGNYDPSSGRGALTGGIDLSRLQDPSVQNFFSPEARLAARQEFDTIRASVAPNVPIGMVPGSMQLPEGATGRAVPRGGAFSTSAPTGSPMGSYVGYGEAGLNAANQLSQFGQQRFADLATRRNTERDAIMRALDNDIQGQKKKGGGLFGFLGKILPFAAAPFTAGLSLPLGLAANAGIGAASAALQGGNPLTGALGGAATGALTSMMPKIPGLGGGAPKAAPATPSFTPRISNPGGTPFNNIRFRG